MNVFLLLQINELKIYRTRFGILAIHDWIILAGGWHKTDNYALCEKLNIKTGEREVLPSMLEGKTNCYLLMCAKPRQQRQIAASATLLQTATTTLNI